MPDNSPLTKLYSIPFHPQVSVARAHESGLVAIDKPSGIMAHPNEGKADNKAIINAPYNNREECFEITGAENEKPTRVYLLNRIDSPTSGIMLISLDKDIAETVKKLFAERKVEKKYQAVVCGIQPKAGGLWKDRLSRKKGAGKVRAVRQAGGDESVTIAKVLKVAHGTIPCTLLELVPKTGRTHQLRIQCATRKMPILGDGTYGDFRFNREVHKITGCKDLLLHARSVNLLFDWKGRKTSFMATVPPPPIFTKILTIKAR